MLRLPCLQCCMFLHPARITHIGGSIRHCSSTSCSSIPAHYGCSSWQLLQSCCKLFDVAYVLAVTRCLSWGLQPDNVTLQLQPWLRHSMAASAVVACTDPETPATTVLHLFTRADSAPPGCCSETAQLCSCSLVTAQDSGSSCGCRWVAEALVSNAAEELCSLGGHSGMPTDFGPGLLGLLRLHLLCLPCQ